MKFKLHCDEIRKASASNFHPLQPIKNQPNKNQTLFAFPPSYLLYYFFLLTASPSTAPRAASSFPPRKKLAISPKLKAIHQSSTCKYRIYIICHPLPNLQSPLCSPLNPTKNFPSYFPLDVISHSLSKYKPSQL